MRINVPFFASLFKTKHLIGQDPWVIPYNTTFLLTQSIRNDSAIAIMQFYAFENMRKAKQAITWQPDPQSDHSKLIWAPELHKFNSYQSNWYIYYSACDGNSDNHRIYVLESDTSDPLGKYHEKGKVYDQLHDLWAIDLTVFEYKNKLYSIWSGWEDKSIKVNDVLMKDMEIPGKFPQNIYIAPMSNPWTINGERTLISTPNYDWEKNIAAINEGPRILQKEDNIFLTYSADASWTPSYKLGMLVFNGDNILDPHDWEKYPKPIFAQGNTDIYGPGRACFVTTKSDNKMIYHSKIKQEYGWERVIRYKDFSWNSNGYPMFGLPQ